MLVARLNYSFHRVSAYGTEATYDSEERVNSWLLSAECFQKTGVPLVVCGPDRALIPIEEASPADDKGHALLTACVATWRLRPVTRETLVKINLCINAAGILFLAAIWMWIAMPWTSLLTLVLGALYGIPGPIPGHDAPACYFGVFCLAAGAFLWMVSYDAVPLSCGRWVAGILLSFLALAWAFLLRQPIGLIGAVAALFFMVVSLLKNARRRANRLKALGVAVVLVWMCTQVTPALLYTRNKLYHVPETASYHSHGIWLSLYLGLGWVSNPWGIIWDDRYGTAIVHQIDPQIRYASYAYYQTLKNLYLHLVITEPKVVLFIYAQKAKQVWTFPLLILGMRLSTWYGLLLMASFVLYQIGMPEARYPLREIMLLALLYAVYAMQGILVIPTGTHLYPLKFCVLLMMAAYLDYFWRTLMVRRLSRAG
jgi:hypothetical protein